MRVGSGWVSTVLQRLTVRLWQDPGVAELIVHGARTSYAARLAALRAALAERGLPSHGRTGINLWLPVPDETRMVTGLREAGYAVAPGSLYRIWPPRPDVRITISPLDESGDRPLADAVARIAGPNTPTSFSA